MENQKTMNNMNTFVYKSDSIYGNAGAAIRNACRELDIQAMICSLTALKVDNKWEVTIKYN